MTGREVEGGSFRRGESNVGANGTIERCWNSYSDPATSVRTILARPWLPTEAATTKYYPPNTIRSSFHTLRKIRYSHLSGSSLLLHPLRHPPRPLYNLHQGQEPLKINVLIRRFSLERLGLTDDILSIRYTLRWQQYQPRPPVPQGRSKIRLFDACYESIEMLPVEWIDEVGIREGEGPIFVRFGSVRPDQRTVLVILLEPCTSSTEDLDDDGLGTTVVGDTMDLVREGEVDGGEVSVVDVA